MTKPIPFDGEGIALFRAPHRVTVNINRELVIVLRAEPDACGLLLFHPASSLRQLHEHLESLFTKISLGRPVASGPVFAKLFGLSQEHEAALRATRDWMRGHGIPITASDLGRNVYRKLIIECATGMVGISYAETFVPSRTPFIDDGSARQRDMALPRGRQVLILTGSPVARVLARQVVEELPDLVAVVPSEPESLFARPPAAEFPYEFLLLFDDAAGPSLTGRWLEMIHQQHPEVRVFWSGSPSQKAPRAAAYLHDLPRLDPEEITEFKRAFHEAVFGGTPAQSAVVLPFPPVRRKR